ncbi:MAG: hypothetical protein RMJ06_00130 [Nitrososphaerota archaeon]|nr:hypothetical protein [Nitrososphaerota archaeon]
MDLRVTLRKVLLPATALALMMSGPPVIALWLLRELVGLDFLLIMVWASLSFFWSLSVALIYLKIRSRP